MDNIKCKLSIDTVLPYIGEFGRFQKILNAVLFTTCLPASFQILIMYFSTMIPPWRCRSNSSECLLNGTQHAYDSRKCRMPRSEWYYTEHKGYSLATQFDIHCHDEWKLHLVSSMIFMGWGFGAIICGWAGDHYGRKSVLYPSIASILTFGFITSFLPNLYLIAACQFCIGFFIPGTQLQAFVLISELVGGKHRPLAGLLVYLTNPVAWSILTLKAYFIRDWKILSIACTVPYCFIFLFYKFVPESIKWLHLHGRLEDAVKIVRKIAKWNNSKIPLNFEIAPPDCVPEHKANPTDIFRTRRLVYLSLTQGFLWLVTGVCYYGLHLAASDLGGNVYRDFVVLNLCEVPGFALAVVFCNVFGRKRAAVIPLFLGGLICIAIAFIPMAHAMKAARVVLGILGDLCLTTTFNSIYPWAVEIYPLHIRNEGMGFLQFVAHAGSAGAPWLVKGLKRYGTWCSFLALGVPALIGSVLAIGLPETKVLFYSDNDKCEKKGDMYTLEKSVIVNEKNVDNV